MTRRIQVFVGLFATTSQVVAIVFFARYMAATDWLFSHHTGSAEDIRTAMWAAAIGLLASVVWLFLAIGRRLAALRPATPPVDVPSFGWYQGITLLVLLLPAGVILRIGDEAHPAALEQARRDRLLKGSPTMAELLEALKSPHDNIRWTAAAAVVKMSKRTPEVAKTVEGAEAAPLAPSQIDAHNALADRERLPELVAALADALKASDPRTAGGESVCVNAINALGAIGADAEPAIPVLVAAVRGGLGMPESKDEHQRDILSFSVCAALAKIGPAGVPPLIELLTDEKPHARQWAAVSLGSMGSQAKGAAVTALIRALQDEDERVRGLAKVALGRIDPNLKRADEKE